MSLTTPQKIWVGFGDAIAAFGLAVATSAAIHINGEILFVAIGGFAVLLGIIFVMVAKKPSTLHMTTSIMFAALGFLTSAAGVYDGNKEIAAIGVLISTLVLVGLNIALFKPNDIKAFNAINITYTALGLVLVGVSVADKAAENAPTYAVIGALTMALASVSTSLIVYGVE